LRNNNLSIHYPIKMIPTFKDYIWGGNRLIKEWGKPSPYEVAAESWELSAHKNGQSVAENGSLKGKQLSEIIEAYGKQCLGTNSQDADRFPILIKLIDSRQKLSIQVHPDDSYALTNEGDYGKTEMWYIVEAQEGSGILCGFKNDMTKTEYRESIQNNTVIDKLNWIEVKKGDVFFISPGTVHAICEGTIIAEIQQNSDVTYRVYDYDRKGPDGSSRPLHIEKAMDVSRLSKDIYDGKSLGAKIDIPGAKCTLLAKCCYFTVKEYEINDSCNLTVGAKSFQSLLFVEGRGILKWGGDEIEFKRGDTFFLPAKMGDYTIVGNTTVLISEV